MPAENYVYLAGHGYDTIYIGYFAIRTYSSGLFIVTRSSPLDSWERMERDRHIRDADLLLILLKNK